MWEVFPLTAPALGDPQCDSRRHAPEICRPAGQVPVRYRGRAAVELAGKTPHQSWTVYTECPDEDFRSPGRVHVDPFGFLHLCQGITIGNLFDTPLSEICARYDPDAHPIVGPLLAGGPAELARHVGVLPQAEYADACHLCYETRRELRDRYPEFLGPDAMYGGFGV